MIEYTAQTFPRDRWPNFSFDELKCRHTGRLCLEPESMDRLQRLRSSLGFPFPIASGYRHTTHPVEARKAAPGAHALGRAFDVAVYGDRAYALLAAATAFGFTGLGIAQKLGSPVPERYIHLDDCGADFHAQRPQVWSY